MKKFFIAAVTVIFALGFASCTSECECVISGPGVPDTVVSEGNVSKSDCKDAEKKANAAVPSGSGVTTKCSSK